MNDEVLAAMPAPEFPEVAEESPGGNLLISFLEYPSGELLASASAARLGRLIGTRDVWGRIADMVAAGVLLPSDDIAVFWVVQVPDVQSVDALRRLFAELSGIRAARARAGLR